MPALDYTYTVGQTVYNIDADHGIRDAVVKKFEATIQAAAQTKQYTIAFKKTSQGSAIVDETTLFPDADSAWAVYKQKYLEN